MTQLSKQDFKDLSDFRFRLRAFQRQSEDICKNQGLTSLQYLLLLHIRGFLTGSGQPLVSYRSAYSPNIMQR